MLLSFCFCFFRKLSTLFQSCPIMFVFSLATYKKLNFSVSSPAIGIVITFFFFFLNFSCSNRYVSDRLGSDCISLMVVDSKLFLHVYFPPAYPLHWNVSSYYLPVEKLVIFGVFSCCILRVLHLYIPFPDVVCRYFSLNL